MIWRIRRFFRKIVLLARWLPVIWRDQPWDECFLFSLLQFKFQLMEEFYNSNMAMSADAKHVAKQVRICKLLCKRLIEEDYTSPWEDRNFKAFDQFDFVDEGKGVLRLVDNCTDLERKYIDWGFKYKEKMIQQDIDLLLRIIKKQVRTWWD